MKLGRVCSWLFKLNDSDAIIYWCILIVDLSKKDHGWRTIDTQMTDKEISVALCQNMLSSSPPTLQDFPEICQRVEDSLQIRNGNNIANVEKSDESVSEEGSLKPSDDLVSNETSQGLDDYAIPISFSSQDLLTNSKCELSHFESKSTPSLNEINQLSFLNRMPDCCSPLPKLEPLENHSIMFSLHIQPGEAPHPYPSSYTDKWDSDYVKMPCSPLNRCSVENSCGEKVAKSKWEIICQSLRSDIRSSKELQEAIMKYNSEYIGKWEFPILHAFINDHLNTEKRDHFFETLLPAMVDMALDLPNICTQPVPLLKTGKDHYVTLSQKQIGCLLLNAFFCTFPQRSCPNNKKRRKWKSEYASYNEINFNRLFALFKRDTPSRKIEKLKCFINYFKRIITKEPSGSATFHRQVIADNYFPNWHASTQGMMSAVIRSSGLIETDGYGMLQVDFADEFVGGGTIGGGCVQEEIRFSICPELIVSSLFVERFDHNEALKVTGVEQYNKYSGYADTFKWEGDFIDEVPRDAWGRKYTQLVAIDAIHFKNQGEQFECSSVKRELNKAYSGFYENERPAHLPAVATGNWGCGVFKGNPNLKFIIQLMAASEAGRSLVYFTFGNEKLKTELQNLYEFLKDNNLTVGDCWQLLMSYNDYVSALGTKNPSDFYDFFHCQFVVKTDSCKHEDGKTEDQNDGSAKVQDDT